MAFISVETAEIYLAAGLSCLPAVKAEKRPAVGSWKTWSTRLPTDHEIAAWFANRPDGVCIVSGAVSGNLECLDFDNHGELFEAWRARVDPAVLAQLVIERTPSGGYHVLYRCAECVEGNLKLARGERDAKLTTLIETRGEGGLFLCAPTEGYELLQGALAALPVLSSEAHLLLLDAARALNEHVAPVSSLQPGVGGCEPWAGGNSANDPAWITRPGDDYAERGDVRPVLEAHGWQLVGRHPDGNELWRRPGKQSGTHSATFDGKVLYVFSSNAAPFESERGYNQFQVLTLLEYGGDFTQAAKELLSKGFGKRDESGPQVDFSGFDIALAQPVPGGVLPTAAPARPRRMTIGELVDAYPKMRKPIIHGFLRVGETMNIIAPPKTGKSWLVTDLALAVATGSPWFGFPCEKGRVLIIDNELHHETSANRIPKVIEARGVPFDSVRDAIIVENQRGSLGNIEDLAREIEELKPYGFKLIIIDAFYRAMPKGTDENDNGTIAGVYNLIDKYAAALDCAFVLIHHTSKGNQSLKSVTDVGAGAGSQSRAADAHVILRRHKEQGVVVMESVVRSFPSVDPICLRWSWPLWNRDDGLNPADLEGKKEDARQNDDPEPWMLAEKLVELVKDPPSVKGVFIDSVKNFYGVTAKTAKLAVESAISSGFIRCERLPHPPEGQHAAKFVLKPL